MWQRTFHPLDYYFPFIFTNEYTINSLAIRRSDSNFYTMSISNISHIRRRADYPLFLTFALIVSLHFPLSFTILRIFVINSLERIPINSVEFSIHPHSRELECVKNDQPVFKIRFNWDLQIISTSRATKRRTRRLYSERVAKYTVTPKARRNISKYWPRLSTNGFEGKKTRSALTVFINESINY